MKILTPPLELADDEGFTPEKDIFSRKPFGNALLNLIKNTDDELVLALDAPWGEGKSTFIQMWRGLLLEDTIQSVYFDAFKNDYQSDPFIAIAGEIYHLIDDTDTDEKNQFKEKSSAALKTIGRIGLRVGIKALTAGVLDETVLEGSDAGEEVSKLVDGYVANRLDSSEQDKKSLDDFRNYLEELATKIGNGKPVVFIIDELDRCKPPFALEVLENIKHLFSVPNIVFVLSMNRSQIEESIRCEYGTEVDASKYLQKFVSLWAHLPKSREKHSCDTKKYLADCLSRMGFSITTQDQLTAKEVFEELVEHYDLSLREIEQSLTNFAIMQNITKDLKASYQVLVVYLSIIKVVFSDSYRKLTKQNISYSELIEKTRLTDFTSDRDDLPEGSWFKWVLFCSLSTPEEIKAVLHNGSFDSHLGSGDISIKTVCGWMESFQ